MDPPYGIRRIQEFKNILVERETSSDFMFMTRRWEPQKTYIPVNKTDPKQIKIDVFQSPKVQEVIDLVSQETGKTKADLSLEVQNILNEIGHDRKLAIVRWMGYVLVKILKKITSGLMVNEQSVNRVKSIMGKAPVVFAPTHRSYADFILLSFVCYSLDIDIPVIAAGMDFESMCVMGRILRSCCAFFMRRSFGSDKLYWAVFGEYVNKLITDNDAPVEFFIEGTRSRSAKSLTPKFGFLSMVMESFFNGRIDDVTIIPINISYDRTLEETLFAYEVIGVPKPRESTSGLVRAMNVMAGLYGKAYVDFGDPISVKMFSSCPEYGLSTCPLDDDKERNSRHAAVVIDLAHCIIRGQQERAVITPFNLIAMVLNHSLFCKPVRLSRTILVEEVTSLRAIIQHFGALVDFGEDDDAQQAVNEALLVHRNLIFFSRSNILTLANNIHPHTGDIEYHLAPGHFLLNDTMKLATPVVMLYHYVNPCLQYLIAPAVVVIILQKHKDSKAGINRDLLYKKYHYLRTLLRSDFVFCKSNLVEDFEDCLKLMEPLGLLEKNPDGSYFRCGKNSPLQLLLSGLVQPFMFSYLTLCAILKENKEPTTVRDLARAAQRKVEYLLMTFCPVHPYSLSLEVFSCGMRSLEVMGALEKVKVENTMKIKAGSQIDRVFFEIVKSIPRVIRRSGVLPGMGDPADDNLSKL